jgi:hypothetical protein
LTSLFFRLPKKIFGVYFSGTVENDLGHDRGALGLKPVSCVSFLVVFDRKTLRAAGHAGRDRVTLSAPAWPGLPQAWAGLATAVVELGGGERWWQRLGTVQAAAAQ